MSVAEEERERLKALVLGFTEGKMHRPWFRELTKLFDAPAGEKQDPIHPGPTETPPE